MTEKEHPIIPTAVDKWPANSDLAYWSMAQIGWYNKTITLRHLMSYHNKAWKSCLVLKFCKWNKNAFVKLSKSPVSCEFILLNNRPLETWLLKLTWVWFFFCFYVTAVWCVCGTIISYINVKIFVFKIIKMWTSILFFLQIWTRWIIIHIHSQAIQTCRTPFTTPSQTEHNLLHMYV